MFTVQDLGAQTSYLNWLKPFYTVYIIYCYIEHSKFNMPIGQHIFKYVCFVKRKVETKVKISREASETKRLASVAHRSSSQSICPGRS